MAGTTTTTAEEAAAKAKEIASRLMAAAEAPPSAADTTTAETVDNKPTRERKRKRWGSAADAATTTTTAAAAPSLPGLAEAARRRALQAQQQQQGTSTATTTTSPTTSTKRVWVPTSHDKPETHFASYLKDRLPDLCAKIKIDDGSHDSDSNRMELAGRGAAKEVVMGMPLEPLHVLIHGSEGFVQAAVPRLDDLLAEAEGAEREGPPPDPRQLGSPGGGDAAGDADYSTALTLTRPYHSDTLTANGGGRRQSEYRPATVAQLISGNPNVLNPTLGVSPEDLLEETVNIPNGVVGFIIGRGGETISSLQARSGCKVQIQKEHELRPGQSHRVITLQSSSQESIDACRKMIEAMVEDRVRAAGGSVGRGGGGGGGGSSGDSAVDAKVHEALAAGHVLVTVDVPDADVGLVIGKAGATVKSIQDQTQSAIQIPTAGNPDDPTVRTVSITSPTQEGADAAKARIESLLQSKPSFAPRGGGGSAGPPHHQGGPQMTIEVVIPDRDVGLCIGRQGCVIKEMQNKTGTRIQIPSQPVMGQPHRVATITGTQEGCEHARGLIDRIVAEQTSACVMSGSPYNNSHNAHGQQQQQQQQQQEQYNDPAWQAYYAAQALAQQQQQQHQQQQQPSASGGQAPDTYYEQFFRYAYYYGEEAARQYYGAWSPPLGTPNPYGVNPTPSPAPPAGASGDGSGDGSASQQAPSASSSTAGGAAGGTIRDTSVRKVSNLPAWMTKS